MSDTHSSCKFCGQALLADSEINATLQCSCVEAKEYSRIQKVLSNAKKSIDEIFGYSIPKDKQAKGEYAVCKEALDFLHTIPALMVDDYIERVSIKLDFQTTATIKIGTKTNLDIHRDNKSRTSANV